MNQRTLTLALGLALSCTVLTTAHAQRLSLTDLQT